MLRIPTIGRSRPGMGIIMTDGNTFDYYVDSVNGDDSNSGRSAGAAYQTISALTGKIAAGTKIGLARGSTWREQLTITANNVTVKAYGTGDAPILDCADLIAAGAWSKTDGYTNIYQVTLTTNYIASEPSFCSVWEDSTRLPIVANLTSLDATAGAYFCANHNTTSPVVYVHATGSGNPAANGMVYEMPTRLAGVYGYAASYLTLEGITCKRSYGNGGAIKMGRFACLVDCISEDGNKHNVYVRTGSSVTGCTATRCYYGASTSGFFAYNDDTPNSEGVSFTNCTAGNGGVLKTTATGFMGHYNTSGSFGTVTYSGCTVADCLYAFGGKHATLSITDCTVTNCANGLSVNANAIITGGIWACTTRVITCGVTGFAVTASGLTATFGEHGIYNNGASFTLTVTGCTLTATANGVVIYLIGATSNVLTANNNVFTHGGGGWTLYRLGANYTYAGDHNNYKPTGNMNVSSTAKTFAEWQALVAPQDANTTVG